MSRKMIHIKKYFIAVFVAFAFLPLTVFAVQISFDAKTTQAQVGKNFEVILLVNTEQENINAFEGKVTFPNDLLDLKEIRDGNSIINFWIDPVRNCVSNGVKKPNEICFSGITPGGYKGKNGLLFSLVFRALKEGQGIIEIRDIAALKNDGEGTAAEVRASNLPFLISEGAPKIQPPKIKDADAPESFVPEIAKDKTLFEGKWFVVFATQDKISGIDHYEIKESRQKFLTFFSRWRVVESPYVLRDQGLRSYIFVKAVDKAGNERIVKLSPQNPLRWYENYENWIIIIVGLLIIAFASRKLWKK